MLPKILKFGFVIVFFFLILFISSKNNTVFADSCSLSGNFYICTDGCFGSNRWVYYYYWDGFFWQGPFWMYGYYDPTCAPPPPPPCPTVYCTDPTGFTSSGAGGSCSFSGQTSTAQSCTYICPDQSRVAGHYNSICSYNSSSQQYCYGSDCSCQPNSPCPTPTPPPCPTVYCTDVTGVTSSGAGGQCSFNGQVSTAQSCTYQCTYPFGPSQNVPGHYTSTCSYNSTAQKYCYGSSCTCAPNSPCPPCPTITCGTNSGAGGVCNYGSSQDQNIPGVTATCPNGQQVPGHSISVCQTNNCYYNDCTPYPNAGACNNGATKTQSTCDSTGQWVQQSQACVTNSSCPTGSTISTPIPTPQPNCSTNPVCSPTGTCPYACSTTNSNARTCTYTGPPGCKSVGSFTCGNPGGPACPDNSPAVCPQSCPTNFNCVLNSCQPSLSISGNVFVDVNVNTLKDAGEINYTGTASFQLNTGTTVNAVNGVFTFPQLLAGTYTVYYTNPPTGAGGYSMTYPVSIPPPQVGNLRIGSGNCTPDPGGHWGCDANGAVINLNFGITNNKPWIQCKGADCRVDSGFTSQIPASAVQPPGPYASVVGAGGTPGLIFTGNSTPNFGQGQASTTGWVVGGSSYGETYSPTKIGGIIKTSYNYLSAKASQGSIPITDLCASDCTLSAIPSASGVYRVNGNLTLSGSSFTFASGKNFVVLVKGNLTVAEKIFVPNGSTAIFSATGNITVDKSNGEAASSTSSTIEGIYSADQSFIADGNKNCSVGPDLRLNVAGSVITNAAQAGGSLQNNRDLCASDTSYPTISFFERPDMVLNTPDFLKNPNFTYQEVAP